MSLNDLSKGFWNNLSFFSIEYTIYNILKKDKKLKAEVLLKKTNILINKRFTYA